MINKRNVLGLLALFITITLTSCVFVRMMKVKSQLNDFEYNFDITNERGLTLVFLNPVLHSSDIVWLMKNEPFSTNDIENGEIWTYVFEKQYLKTDNENKQFDIPLLVVVNEDKVTEITFPKRFLKYMSIPALKKMLSSMGDADINKLRRSASSIFETDNAAEIPTIAQVTDMLGKPYTSEKNEQITSYKYLYYLQKPQEASDYNLFELKTEFVFDNSDEKLQSFNSIIRGIKMHIDLSTIDNT